MNDIIGDFKVELNRRFFTGSFGNQFTAYRVWQWVATMKVNGVDYGCSIIQKKRDSVMFALQLEDALNRLLRQQQ